MPVTCPVGETGESFCPSKYFSGSFILKVTYSTLKYWLQKAIGYSDIIAPEGRRETNKQIKNI